MSSFPVPLSPDDQDGTVIGSDVADEFKDFHHLLTLSDDIFKMEFILQLGAQIPVLEDQGLFFEGPFHHQGDHLGVDRFFDEIEGPHLHGLNRLFNRPLGRDDDHFCLRFQLLDRLQEGHAIHFGHDEIRNHQVHHLVAKEMERLLSVGRQEDRVPPLLQGGAGCSPPRWGHLPR